MQNWRYNSRFCVAILSWALLTRQVLEINVAFTALYIFHSFVDGLCQAAVSYSVGLWFVWILYVVRIVKRFNNKLTISITLSNNKTVFLRWRCSGQDSWGHGRYDIFIISICYKTFTAFSAVDCCQFFDANSFTTSVISLLIPCQIRCILTVVSIFVITADISAAFVDKSDPIDHLQLRSSLCYACGLYLRVCVNKII